MGDLQLMAQNAAAAVAAAAAAPPSAGATTAATVDVRRGHEVLGEVEVLWGGRRGGRVSSLV